jgi:tRNA (guanine37-N1)-methyltransferase
MVIIDAVTRLLPGALGDDESARDESFSQSLLEYPHYTRPAEFRGMKVPEVLLSGHHAEIVKWRAEQARERTAKRRPDLLNSGGPGDTLQQT